MGRKQRSPSGIVFRARVARQTPEKLEKLAASMGHLYGGKGKPGAPDEICWHREIWFSYPKPQQMS